MKNEISNGIRKKMYNNGEMAAIEIIDIWRNNENNENSMAGYCGASAKTN